MEITGKVREMIAKVLISEYNPSYITIFDDSQEYDNYRNEMYRESKETHFTIYIKSSKFDGMPIYMRKQAVEDLITVTHEIPVTQLLLFCYDSTETTVWMNL